MRQLARNFHGPQPGMKQEPFGLLLMPAYSVAGLIRAPLGYHIVKPVPAIIRTVLLIVLPLVWWWFYVGFTNQPMPNNAGHEWLIGFAVLSLAATLLRFIKRVFGAHRGEIHSLEAGYSLLALYTPIPILLTELVLVPGLFGAAGWGLTRTVSTELGYWLIACALSLLLMAVWERVRQRDAMLAIGDGVIQAQTSGERIEQQGKRAKGRAASGGQGPEFAELGGRPAGQGRAHRQGERRDFADLG